MSAKKHQNIFQCEKTSKQFSVTSEPLFCTAKMSKQDVNNSITAASLSPELWTASSNEALQLFITDNKGTAHPFNPSFTYPIFGDSESVFGFQDLVIFLCFDSVTFLPFLNVKYSNKLNDEDIEIDPKAKLLEFLPESTVFKDEVKWRDLIEEEQKSYEIPGEILAEFSKGDDKYAIYKLNLKSAQGLELHKRLQILVLLFIEAGSYIESEDACWEICVLYDMSNESLPEIVGFSTVYNYWKYPGFEKFDNGAIEIRKKVSQFVILPTYQGKGLGGEFYQKLYELWLKDDRIIEIVIEDPNESFDDLRDRNDVVRLVDGKVIDLNELSVELASDQAWFNKLKTSQKLEKRQLSRLLEMLLLYTLKSHDSTNLSKKKIRLFIKRRLYEKNKEALLTLDQPTRLDKLQTAYDALEQDYYRIMGPIKLSNKRSAGDAQPSKKIKFS